MTLLVAMNGRSGFELAVEQRPDLILLDLHLPDISGDEVLQLVRADPLIATTPVVMLSADAMADRPAPSTFRKPAGLPGTTADRSPL